MSRYDLEPFDLDNATRKKPGGRIYGGGGGSSSSASTTSTTTQNTDKRQVVDNGGFGVTTDNSTVNISHSLTDYGALNSAANFSNSALNSAASSLSNTGKALADSFSKLVSGSQAGVSDAASVAQAGIGSAEKLAGTAITTNAANFTTLLDTARMLTLSAINTQTANTALSKELAGTTSAAYQDSATTKQQSTNLMYAALAVAAMVGFSVMKKKRG